MPVHSYPTVFFAAASKCILHVKLDLALAGESARRQNPKSCEIRDKRGGLLDGCHNFRISILTVAERARASALSNVQTFALYFNFATLNMPSSSPPTSSTPALSSLRRVCNNSLIPGDERPESLLPRSSLSLTPSGKVHFNQATCLIWRYPRRTDNNR